MSMCEHEIAAAAVADAMSVIYDVADIDPATPVAVQLTNTLYMETVIALQQAKQDGEWHNPENN